MGLHRIDDTKLMDAFDLPSFFDPRLNLYKEWHDFVFFDRASRVFGLLNFAVHGNPYDSKRGYGAALAFLVDAHGKPHTAMKLISINELAVSQYSPDFVSKDLSVIYRNGAFKISGDIAEVSLDLGVRVALPPVSTAEIALDIIKGHEITAGMLQALSDLTKLWDKWIELPSLTFDGVIRFGGVTHSIGSKTGYQDHEGGRFDWGQTWGWDTGVLLCDPELDAGLEKASFLLYRGGARDEDAHGGIIIRLQEGGQTYFDESKITISRTGSYSGEIRYIPGITRLLYPDYLPDVPEKVVFSAIDGSAELEISFRPKAVCSIVLPSLIGTAETVFNEMFCAASLKAKLDGKVYNLAIPCWFESVRPRRGIVG